MFAVCLNSIKNEKKTGYRGVTCPLRLAKGFTNELMCDVHHDWCAGSAVSKDLGYLTETGKLRSVCEICNFIYKHMKRDKTLWIQKKFKLVYCENSPDDIVHLCAFCIHSKFEM